MSRQILEVTLRLGSGKVLTGRGRNLPATIERIYNRASSRDSRKQVTITEPLKTGHLGHGEHRYEGTFHVTLASSPSGADKESAIAEVRKPGADEPK